MADARSNIRKRLGSVARRMDDDVAERLAELAEVEFEKEVAEIDEFKQKHKVLEWTHG